MTSFLRSLSVCWYSETINEALNTFTEPKTLLAIEEAMQHWKLGLASLERNVELSSMVYAIAFRSRCFPVFTTD